MGFNIWATGITGSKSKMFHYSKKNCLDQGDFEPPKLLTMIPSSPNAGGVAKKIVGTPSSHIGGATVKAMFKMAEMHSIHLLNTSINLLSANSNGGKISVYCEEEKWYWADSNSFVNFYMSGGDLSRSFMRKISPGLVKTGLNNFGVLMQIAMCISEYDRKLQKHVTPNLSISLTH